MASVPSLALEAVKWHPGQRPTVEAVLKTFDPEVTCPYWGETYPHSVPCPHSCPRCASKRSTATFVAQLHEADKAWAEHQKGAVASGKKRDLFMAGRAWCQDAESWRKGGRYRAIVCPGDAVEDARDAKMAGHKEREERRRRWLPLSRVSSEATCHICMDKVAEAWMTAFNNVANEWFVMGTAADMAGNPCHVMCLFPDDPPEAEEDVFPTPGFHSPWEIT